MCWVELRSDRVVKRRGDLMVESHDLETREREWWWESGTLAMHWTAMSSGRLGSRRGGGGASVVVVVVEFSSAIGLGFRL